MDTPSADVTPGAAPPKGLGARLRDLFQRHRKRLATLALVLFLALVALEISSAIPRQMRVSLPMGVDHTLVTEARIDYFEGDEAVHSVTLRWPHGAPASVRHDLELSPGEYQVSVLLVQRDGRERHLSGRLSAPAEGVVRLALEES